MFEEGEKILCYTEALYYLNRIIMFKCTMQMGVHKGRIRFEASTITSNHVN